MTVKCRTAIKALYVYLSLCPSVMFDSLLCSFTVTSFLSIYFIIEIYSDCEMQNSNKRAVPLPELVSMCNVG